MPETDRYPDILGLLDLDRIGENAFSAPASSDRPGPLLGSPVASQSLRAASLTVPPDRTPHSLHAYFMRSGRGDAPVRLEVERTRDGRSFATRRVMATQEGSPVFTLAASFHTAQPGDDWQISKPVDVPGPDEMAGSEALVSRSEVVGAFDVLPAVVEAGRPSLVHPYWARLRQRIPDDPVLHACVLTFVTDVGVNASARVPGSSLRERLAGVSLDHAVWFHRPARVDHWLLFSVEAVTNSGSRGLATGGVYTREGVLVASIAQEVLLRSPPLRPL